MDRLAVTARPVVLTAMSPAGPNPWLLWFGQHVAALLADEFDAPLAELESDISGFASEWLSVLSRRLPMTGR